MVWRGTPREVAATAEVVFSMVTDNAALQAITCAGMGFSPAWRQDTRRVPIPPEIAFLGR
jgi:3-hydroxyisobutyrate dehydrogenase-like beta-hydroxyacid dehydrogenase